MTIEESVLKASVGAVFIQRGGANRDLALIGCATLEDMAEPRGGRELIQCFAPNSTRENPKWNTVGKSFSPPESPTTSIDTLLFPGSNELERVRGEFALYALSRVGGRAESFDNYVRGSIYTDARITNRTDSMIKHRNEDTESNAVFEIEGDPPILRIFDIGSARQATVETENAISCFFFEDNLDAIDLGLTGLVTTAGGLATSNVLRTVDGGDNWAAVAADPFAIGESIMSVVQIEMDADTVRWIVIRDTKAATPLEIAYSDDEGATWTTVALGVTAAQAATGPRALFALDRFHIWAVADAGFVYFSEDAGQTWTDQESGSATAQDINAVHFYDQNNGVAVTDTDEIIITSDGGKNWAATAAVTGGGNNLNSVATMNGRIWIGDDGGQLWFSEDDGATWTERTGWIGSGVGDIPDIDFTNDYTGFMISNTAAPVGTILQTINGGRTWAVVDTPTNVGLTSVFAVDENTAYITGLVQAATAFIAKVSA